MQPGPEMQPTTPPTMTTPAPMQEVEISDEEKAAWTEELKAISEHIGLHQYDSARSKLESAKSLAKTQAQKVEHTRLGLATQLAEECQQALVEAVTSLGAGETITVGSRPLSIVEGDSQKLIARLSGRNTTFQLTELPVGIFEGLIDLTLDIKNEAALARRAAFIMFHPKNNDLALKKARERMQAAEDAGKVPDGITELFDAEFLQQ